MFLTSKVKMHTYHLQIYAFLRERQGQYVYLSNFYISGLGFVRIVLRLLHVWQKVLLQLVAMPQPVVCRLLAASHFLAAFLKALQLACKSIAIALRLQCNHDARAMLSLCDCIALAEAMLFLHCAAGGTTGENEPFL